MKKEYHFFFDEDGMPLAVFLTETAGEAYKLFARLYRRPWSESWNMGIRMVKEVEVSPERWNEIHYKYLMRAEKKVAPCPKPRVIKLNSVTKQQTTGLETEKYMSRM